MSLFTKSALSLAIAALAIIANISSASATNCYNKCRFRFCNGESSFPFGKKSDTSFTGAICDKTGRHTVGHVGSSGEALVVVNKNKVERTVMTRHIYAVPISQWSPSGLKQRFSPSFFKSFGVYKRCGNRMVERSGIGHEVAQQNQKAFLASQCFFVPITAYQVMNKKNHVVDNKHPRDTKRDCIAFSLSSSMSGTGPSCYNKCRFRFCDGRTRFNVGDASDKSFTGAICDKMGHEVVGHVASTGEAHVVLNKKRTTTATQHRRRSELVRISKWHPQGLKQSFSPSFFKSACTYTHRGKFRVERAAVSHEVSQQNQGHFVKSRCFVLPLKAFQLKDRNEKVVANKHSTDPTRDCVSFCMK